MIVIGALNENVVMKNGLPIYQDYDFMYQKIVVEQLSNNKIADEANCSYSVIQAWSKRLNIDKPEPVCIQLAESDGEAIKKMYIEDKMYLEDIGNVYNVGVGVIKQALTHLGVKLRTMTEAKLLRDERNGGTIKYNLNEDYFKTWSSDMAYILGFIAADGCVHIKVSERISGNSYENYSMTINLQKGDVDVLEKIKDALEFEGNIRHYKASSKGAYGYGNDYVSIAINSKPLCTDLIELGIIPRKSLVLEYPSIPEEYAIDFIRGYFDGNGTVGSQYPKSNRAETKTAQIRVRFASGSHGILDGIQQTLTSFGFKPKKITAGKRGNIFDLCYSTKESLMLYELFYADENCLKMNRKFEKFKELIELRNSDASKSTGYIKVK